MGRLPNVAPGEGRLVSTVLAMMIAVWAGFAVGGNGIEGLLFARVGPDALPYLYVALGIAAAAVMFGINAVLARPRPQRLLLLAFPLGAGIAALIRGLLLLASRWVYPMAWLAMMIMWTGAIVVTWGIAGAVHDTRQAKRLFPVYASGVILGIALGGLVTAPLAQWIGAANLSLLWAAAVAAGFFFARSAVRVAGIATRPVRRSGAGTRGGRIGALRMVGNSRLLTSMTELMPLLRSFIR